MDLFSYPYQAKKSQSDDEDYIPEFDLFAVFMKEEQPQEKSDKPEKKPYSKSD